MGIRLLIYLFILFVGGVLGYNDKINPNVENKLSLLQAICMYFLLFIMGIRIGLDEKVINSFLIIGYKASIIAIFTLVFSVLFVRFFKRFIIIKRRKDVIEP